MNLINDILDLSKIESGTIAVEAEEVPFAQPARRSSSGRSATSPSEKGLPFDVSSSTRTSAASIDTDDKRLQQVLKNLLSNAFKFTEPAAVRVSVSAVGAGSRPITRSWRARAA